MSASRRGCRLPSDIRNVWVGVELAFSSQRDILFGISNYAKCNALWRLAIANGDRNASCAKPTGSVPPDGIITTLPLSAEVADSGIPIVVIGAREEWLGRRQDNLAFVRNDDWAIGNAVARKFVSSRLYASFGFVGSNVKTYCPQLREEGFRAGLEKGGSRDIRSYDQKEHIDGSSADMVMLGDWLENLSKPAAVFAVHDLRATHVIAAANERGLSIPDELSVIGVDNDEVLCELTDPPLTSVSPDHVQTGRLAASALDTLFNKGVKIPQTRKVVGFEIVERDTTRSTTPSEHLAKEAMAFIRQNFKSGIRAEDVIRSVPGRSRRLVDARFQEMFSCSLHEAILRVRYAELKRRLVRSKVPIGELMRSCGFSDLSNAKRLFKSRFGMSMREWRNRQGVNGNS